MQRHTADTITDDALDDLYDRLGLAAKLADGLTDFLHGEGWELAFAIERLANGTATVDEINAEMKAAQ